MAGLRRARLAVVAAVLLPGPLAAAKPTEPMASARAPAAGPRPVFRTVGRDVIPRDVVKTLAQDTRGFLWVATGGGRVRHDGYRCRRLAGDHPDRAAGRRGSGGAAKAAAW